MKEFEVHYTNRFGCPSWRFCYAKSPEEAKYFWEKSIYSQGATFTKVVEVVNDESYQDYVSAKMAGELN